MKKRARPNLTIDSNTREPWSKKTVSGAGASDLSSWQRDEWPKSEMLTVRPEIIRRPKVGGNTNQLKRDRALEPCLVGKSIQTLLTSGLINLLTGDRTAPPKWGTPWRTTTNQLGVRALCCHHQIHNKHAAAVARQGDKNSQSLSESPTGGAAKRKERSSAQNPFTRMLVPTWL